MDENFDETHDVVVIGGGAAGLSGAVALARSRRSVLVVDSGEPRNAPADHVHNFLTRDGTRPADIYALGRDEVTRYGGQVRTGRVLAVRPSDDGFAVELTDRTVHTRRVLVATGARDVLPDVPGLAEGWGHDVLHCPYCHGWEVRDQRVGILATGPAAVHQALMFRQLSEQVTVLAHVAAPFTDEQREQLAALGIPVVEGEVVEVERGPDGLTGVRLADGRRTELDALVVAPLVEARVEALAPLGLEPVEVRMGEHLVGRQLEADPMGATKVSGVWAAGNAAGVQAQVVTSAAAGLMAGSAINADLIAEDTSRAVAAHRYEQAYGEQAWDDRYREHDVHWSGDANSALVAEVADLPPGTALDAGCGEGADARWLAARGWQVSAADLSSVALDRAAATAARDGLTVNWLHLDLSREPAPGTYDLVTSHYLHVPPDRRTTLFRNLAAAVAPGGTLLVVGHDPSETPLSPPPPGLGELRWAATDVGAVLGELGADGQWEVQVAEARPRTIRHQGRGELPMLDSVFRARRVS